MEEEQEDGERLSLPQVMTDSEKQIMQQQQRENVKEVSVTQRGNADPCPQLGDRLI
jgi:hypothetical protein